MKNIYLALQQSLLSLKRPKVWFYILLPALLALFFMSVSAIFLLNRLVALLIEQPPMTWITAWGAFWLAKIISLLGGWALIVSASYLLVILLTSIVMMPLMLKNLAENDYPHLAKMGQDNFISSSWNSVFATLLFLTGWLITFPLWIVPGLSIVLPIFWMAWLNRRTFAYDALAVHASPDESRELRDKKSGGFLGLGVVMVLLITIPILGLIAPSFGALAYIHYALSALDASRQGAILTIPKTAEQFK